MLHFDEKKNPIRRIKISLICHERRLFFDSATNQLESVCVCFKPVERSLWFKKDQVKILIRTGFSARHIAANIVQVTSFVPINPEHFL